MVMIIVNLFFAILLLFLCMAFWTGAPFVPSTKKTAKAMIDQAKLKSTDTVYDLGSGDGRLLFLAAKKGIKKGIGVEINPWLVIFTNLRILFSSYRTTLSCQWGDFWKKDFSSADVVFVYLLPWKMEALQKKLQKELKPGTRIVSNSFIFPHWKQAASDPVNHVYVFEV